MENKLIKSTKYASIFTKDNTVYKVNDEFLQIVGYKYYEIVGKSLKQLSILLKMNFQIYFTDIKDVEDLYIFTNEDVPKDVTITYKSQSKANERLYYIEENLNPSLEVILLNFANNDINSEEGQAIYSYPSLICLKSNEKYNNSLDLMTVKYDNLIGCHHPCPKYLSEINETGSFRKNAVEHIDSNGIRGYWDVNMKLIYGHENRIFIISTFYDVTDRIIKMKFLGKQRVEMEIILDNISDSINKVN